MATYVKKSFEVFVSRIPWTVAKRDLREHFKQFGVVKNCFLPFDKDTGFHKGICWIRYSTMREMNNALQNSHVLEGTTLQVQKNIRVDDDQGPKSYNDLDSL